MKRIAIFLVYLSTIFSVGYAQSDYSRADSVYSEENYPEAIRLYEGLIQSHGPCSTIYYNLGNAYYRVDSIAKAILCYERALRLNPLDGDARFNLDFVNEKYNLSHAEMSATARFVSGTTNIMSANAWAILSLVLFTAFLGCVAVYVIDNEAMHRKIAFFSGLVLIPITLASVYFAFRSHSNAVATDTCIVIKPSTQLSTVPSAKITQSQQAFIAPEGYRLEIIDSVSIGSSQVPDVWYEVKVENDNHAWVNSKDVEII